MSFIQKMKVAIKFVSDAFSCDRNCGRGSSLREGTAYLVATVRSEPMSLSIANGTQEIVDFQVATPKDFLDEAA